MEGTIPPIGGASLLPQTEIAKHSGSIMMSGLLIAGVIICLIGIILFSVSSETRLTGGMVLVLGAGLAVWGGMQASKIESHLSNKAA